MVSVRGLFVSTSVKKWVLVLAASVCSKCQPTICIYSYSSQAL